MNAWSLRNNTHEHRMETNREGGLIKCWVSSEHIHYRAFEEKNIDSQILTVKELIYILLVIVFWGIKSIFVNYFLKYTSEVYIFFGGEGIKNT